MATEPTSNFERMMAGLPPLPDQPDWAWERHGDGWALMQGRISTQHGMNRLTVEADGFDANGEWLRGLTARLLNEHSEGVDVPALRATVTLLRSELRTALTSLRDAAEALRDPEVVEAIDRKLALLTASEARP